MTVTDTTVQSEVHRQDDDTGRLPPIPTWLLVGAVAAVLAVLAAGLLALPGGPVWQSRATLLIDQPQAIAVSQDPGIIEKLSRLRFKYAGLVGTADFADLVDDPTAEAGDAQLLASVPPDSLLLHVGARGDRDTVQGLSDAGAAALIDYVDRELNELELAPEQRFTLTVVSPASAPQRLDGSRRGLALATLVGAGALGVASFVLRRRTHP